VIGWDEEECIFDLGTRTLSKWLREKTRMKLYGNIKANIREIGYEVAGTSSGSCPVAVFGKSGVEPLESVIIMLDFT
jgi:hypothetical protein